jgi:O-acetyl-ADP-ribose deacetylase (regulator of RNase III)
MNNILDIDLADKTQTIVIPVNCVGVMGAGLAKQFAVKYPVMCAKYRKICSDGYMNIDTPVVVDKNILLFPTKQHWKDKSQYYQIKKTLCSLLDLSLSSWVYYTQKLHMPQTGCGLGGLEWSTVKPMIADAFTHERLKHIEIVWYE